MKRLDILIAVIVSVTIIIMACSDGQKTEDMDASVNGGCPGVQPTFPDMFCSGDMGCGYGFACCCGACSTAIICNCVNGRYECTDTGVCDNPRCEDAGADGG